MKNCSYYLKADYSLKCFGKTHNTYITAFYVGSDKFEHLLQLASLIVTFFNLSVGALLRIPSEMVDYSIEKDKDSVGVTILLVTANVMVIGLVVGQYSKPLCPQKQSVSISCVINPHHPQSRKMGVVETSCDRVLKGNFLADKWREFVPYGLSVLFCLSSLSFVSG